MKDDRRSFLKTVGGVPLALAGTAAAGQDRGEGRHDASAAPIGRDYGTARFLLDVDGATVGILKDYDGGMIGAEVVQEAPGDYGVIGKHLGRLQYEDLLLTTSSDLLKPPFFNWVADTLGGSFIRHDGSVHALDSMRKERRLTQFKDALLTEVGFPSLDAGSKDTALFHFVIEPGRLEVKAGSGEQQVTLKPSPA